MANYDFEKLTPAPFNQKDICEDFLFEQIFDNGDYLCNERVKPHVAIGFIHDIPCMLEWSFNSHCITVTPMKIENNESWTAEILILRLTQYNDEPDSQTVCDASDYQDLNGPFRISAAYYYKPEDELWNQDQD